MPVDLSVALGPVGLKNPLICGAGEHTITDGGMRACLSAGAAAVVAKSTNESAAAKRQLDGTDYLLLDGAWNPLPWDFHPPREAQLFGRSGLVQEDFEPWVARLAVLDREARASDAYVIASLILADLDSCVRQAVAIEQAGLRILELNIGAPHGDEAAKGAIVVERVAERVTEVVRRVRDAIRIPLWVKLTGQSEDVAALVGASRAGGADAVVVMGRFMGFVPDLVTQSPHLGTAGAIGGPWSLALTCRWLALARKKYGSGVPLIATNGARDGLDIARFMLAGASAVEMTSAVMAGGFAVVRESLTQITDYAERQQGPLRELIGRAADRLESYEAQPARPGYWRRFVPPEARE